MNLKNRSMISIKKKIKYRTLITNKLVITIGLMLMFQYVAMSSMTYINTYLNNVLNIDYENLVIINVIRNNIFPLLITPLFGIMVDKIRYTNDLLRYVFLICLSLFMLFLFIYNLKSFYILQIIILICLSLIIVGSKIISLTILNDIKIDPSYTGSIIGLVTFIAYSLDFYYYPIAGRLLDISINRGFYLIIIISMISLSIGCVLSLYLKHKIINSREL